MSFSGSAPAAIASLKTMLESSMTWNALTIATGGRTIHYPTVNLNGESGAASPLPVIVIFPTNAQRTKFAVGAAGVAGGELVVRLHMTGDEAAVEAAGNGILNDLMSNDAGLAIHSGTCSPPSDPTPGMRAANATGHITNYRTITITLQYGLTP